MASRATKRTALEGFAVFAFFAIFFAVFFAPAEFGKLMASGDASVESLPALLGPRHLWENAMLLGYPLYADPNQQQWYPLAWIASLPHFYNAFSVAPFPIAAFGVWGFIRTVTRSSFSGIVAGLIFALGGFMISHAGHLMISHPAAWAPYLLWSIEAQRRKSNGFACVGGAAAIGLCAVSGQPQVLAFILALAAGYVVVSSRGATAGTRSFAIAMFFTFAIGIGFGCVQLVPEAALAHHSTRSSISLSDFTALEVPIAQLAMRVVFPYALGVTRLPGYAYSGLDLGTFTEDTIAVGMLAVVLALVSCSSFREDRRITYWFGISAIALVLAVGDATPLPSITHRLPVYGLLRIPGRHAFEWTLAIAVLAGYGADAIRKGQASRRWIIASVAIVTAIVAIAFFQFTAGAASPANFVAQTFNVAIGLVTSPTTNGALGIPLSTGAIGIALFCIAARFRSNRFMPILLTIAVVLDSGTFAYAAYWNWGAIDPNSLRPASFVSGLAQRLESEDSRVAWLPGNLAGALAPNLTTLWHVPTVDGYSPLVPQRAVQLLGLTPSGGITIPGFRSVNLDIAGVSILAIPRVPNATVSAAAPFATDTIHLFFSFKHNDAVTHADLGLPHPLAATAISYVSELGESTEVPQNADVASITAVFSDGTHERHEILAGRDTAEFAFDRPDVKPFMKHARATIYSSAGPGHTYVAQLSLKTYKPITHVMIDWHYPTAALTLEKLSLVDARTGSAHAFDSLAPLYADSKHWQPIPLDPSILAFRNLRAMPHAWVAQPLRFDADAISTVIRDGVFPVGATFEPSRRALVEEEVEETKSPVLGDSAKLESQNESDVIESVRCVQTCFVVDRDAFDTDWNADVDGIPTHIFATDIDLRGVRVPAGVHRLHFHFFPGSLALGSAIAAMSAFFALSLLMGRRLKRNG